MDANWGKIVVEEFEPCRGRELERRRESCSSCSERILARRVFVVDGRLWVNGSPSTKRDGRGGLGCDAELKGIAVA